MNTSVDHAGFAGVFKWYFERSNTSRAYFKGQMNRLVTRFGIDSIRDIQVPNLKNMGYVKAEVDIVLDINDVKKLLETTKSENLYNEMYTSAFDRMNTFFESGRNYRSFCGKLGKITMCKTSIYRDTWSALSSIPRVLDSMRSSLVNKDLKAFSHAFGRLGKLTMTNRFVFKEMMKRVGKADYTPELHLQGSRILKTKLAL